MKKLVYSLIVLATVFAACKSNQSSEEDLEKQKAKQEGQTKATTNNSEYLIVAPDTDYTGDYMDRYPNGIIKFTGFFRFGERHGQWMAFYDNGIKWSECFYDKGKKHGASIVYHPNGKINYSGWFKNDMRDSLWIFYNEEGKEIDRRAYKNDQETGLTN